MMYSRFFTLVSLFLSVALLSGCGLLGDADDEVRVEVVHYEGPELTAGSALDGWEVLERDGDDITLALTFSGFSSDIEDRPTTDVAGLQPGQTVFLTLSDASQELPSFEELWVGIAGGAGRTMNHGTIMIQDWNPDGTISGIIDVRTADRRGRGLGVAFWIDGR